MTRSLLALAPLALLAAACGPRYDGVDIKLHSEPPVPVRVSDNEFELPTGIAVAIEVKPLSSNQFDYYQTDQLDLRSDDRGVLRVEPTENPRRFILIGVSPGETCVELEVDYEERGCIPATVLAPPP